MPKRKGVPVARYPWARHHYKEGTNGYDRGCHAWIGTPSEPSTGSPADSGERWRGPGYPVHDPGPLSPETKP